MTTDLDMLARATEMMTEAASFVEPGSLTLPTPCDGWDVAELLDHVTGGNRFTVQILQGHTADDALVATIASFDSDKSPSDALAESAAAQLRACKADGVLAGTFHHVVGDLTGEQVLRLRVHDVCIHVWDLLQAVNPKKGLDPVYVRWAIDELAKPDSLTAQHMATSYPNPGTSYELLLAFGRRRTSAAEHLRGDL
jgi:uncharacterized protein (TIGR03086 family)